jgi:DNA-binding NarL/FixJ family response regulator
MSDNTKMSVNAITGETTISELTDKEKNWLKDYSEKEQAKENEILAQAASRQSALAKLAALGLTEEEIAAL